MSQMIVGRPHRSPSWQAESPPYNGRKSKRPACGPNPNPRWRQALLPGSKLTGRGSFIAVEIKKQEREIMKKVILSIALACVAPFAWGQVSETTTTTTTTDASGTITEYTPGSAIVLKESSGPRRYRFGKSVTYVTRSGKPLDETVVKEKVKVGVPVRVHYVGTGDSMMVDRVILDED